MLATQIRDFAKIGEFLAGQAILKEQARHGRQSASFEYLAKSQNQPKLDGFVEPQLAPVVAPQYRRVGQVQPVKHVEKSHLGKNNQPLLDGFVEPQLAVPVAPQVEPAPVKHVGRSLLTKVQIDFLRMQLIDHVPSELGFSKDAYWNPRSVRQFILSEWEVQVSASTARNYIRKFNFNSPTPLNRLKSRTFEQQRWLSEELPLLRRPLADEAEEAGLIRKNVFYISCKPPLSGDVFRTDKIQLHAVSNTGGAMFAFVPKNDRKEKLGQFLEVVSGGHGAVYVFDDSIIAEFKDEAVEASSQFVKHQPNPKKARQKKTNTKMQTVFSAKPNKAYCFGETCYIEAARAAANVCERTGIYALVGSIAYILLKHEDHFEAIRGKFDYAASHIEKVKAAGIEHFGAKKYKEVIANKVRRYLSKSLRKIIVQIGFVEKRESEPAKINKSSFDMIMLGWVNSSA